MDKTKEEQPKYEVSSGNVFKDLGLDQPEELLAKARLLNEVSNLIKSSGVPQKKIAERLGISQPKVSMLVGGRLSAFSTETLLRYLYILGCEVQIHVKKPRTKNGIFTHRGCLAVSG